MKVSTLLIGVFAAGSVTAQQASSSARVPVVGLTGGVDTSTSPPSRPNRLPIGTLQSSGAQWDLYIQALAAFQAVAESDEKSYFQITGIHGLPYVSWNGVGQVSGGGGGYCPHNEILFATWHRPFLALFEQILVGHAATIAAQYTGSSASTYQAAAKTLRIPYWDWAVSAALPSAATSSTVTINTPTGRKSISNPLYSYKFQKFPFTYANFGGSIGRYPATIRCPSSTSSSAVSQANVVNSNLAGDASYLKNSVYLTFTRSNAYNIMATDGSGGYSFESPHNTVHNDVGCGSPSGHMVSLAWSAFDPIFMLHHANVDRLVAMWQAAHPSTQLITGTQRTQSAQYGSASGTSFSATSGLKPFYKSGGTSLWTNTDQSKTSAFGYTYPELQDWTMSTSDLQKSVISQVNNLYGTSSTTATKKRSLSKRSTKKRADTDIVTQYMAEISVDRADLQLPSTMKMYLGDELAGTFTLLNMPATGRSFGQIPLQEALLNFKSDAGETAKDTVVRLLKTVLRVELTTADGTTKSILNVPSLTVNLEISAVQPPQSEFEFPTYLNTTTAAVALKDLLTN